MAFLGKWCFLQFKKKTQKDQHLFEKFCNFLVILRRPFLLLLGLRDDVLLCWSVRKLKV